MSLVSREIRDTNDIEHIKNIAFTQVVKIKFK